MRRTTMLLLASCLVSIACAEPPQSKAPRDRRFDKDQLVAWCIVPFDANKRGPQERVEMLDRLGIKRVAYDWRDEHVPMFEAEILEYKKHGIEFFAFWDQHDEMFALFERHGISPQVWKMIPAPADGSDQEKVETAGRRLLPLVKRTRELGCKLGLYNHGGWAGQPEQMVAVCQWLRDHADANHVGIVYNMHHGHEHIQDFAAKLTLMQPYLLCLNLNGMNDDAEPKILPVGRGQHDEHLLRLVRRSAYDGPIGILDHRAELDAEQSLRENLDGLSRLMPD